MQRDELPEGTSVTVTYGNERKYGPIACPIDQINIPNIWTPKNLQTRFGDAGDMRVCHAG